MLFGRAQEELDALAAAGVTVEVVPGVTAALAAAADARLSLTRRGVSRSVVFVTPRVGEGESPVSWAQAAAAADTAVIYMGAGDAQGVRAALIDAGLTSATPVALIESASRPDSVVAAATLAELPALAARRGNGPVLIVVGAVCAALATAVAPELVPEIKPVYGRRATR
jgi:uroporphyrin-III C-methyltransferase